MTKQTTNEWLTTHTGEDCAACDTPYETCTRAMFRGHAVCCPSCYQYNTHNERTVSVEQRRIDRLADAAFEGFKPDLPFSSWTVAMRADVVRRVLAAEKALRREEEEN